MKALVLREYNRLVLEDVPNPTAGPGEVLVAVRACGICGSDVHGMDGSTGRRRPPVIMGHEAAGVVAEVGANVAGWKAGHRVTFDSTIFCGKCDYCRSGAINLCENRRVLGVSCEEYRQDGAFAQYVVVPERVLHRLPDSLSFEHAALAEPLSVALHAVRRASVTKSDTAVVIGCGIIGLLAVQALRVAGCGKIVAVDIAPDRLAVAAKVGAGETVTSGPDAVQDIMRITGGRGADLAIEAVGITSTVDLALRIVRKGGAVTLVGNVSPNVQFPLQQAVTRELAIRGSCASAGEYPACLDLLSRGAVLAAPVISAVAPLSEGASWFNRLYNKEAGLLKVMLVPES